MTLTEEIFDTLADSNDSAAIGQFMELLRRVPGLRQWLRAVTIDTMARQKLNAFLDGRVTPPMNLTKGRRLLKWIAGANDTERDDAVRLQRFQNSVNACGGLSRVQIVALIRRYQAGRIDCASFLILHALRRDLAGQKHISPATCTATIRFVSTAVAENHPQLLKHLALAAEFFDGQAIGTIKSSHFGHSAWWKMNLLTYMLHNPQLTYRTGVLVKHLASMKIAVDPSDIRRFCRQHGISRDTRRGRPKKVGQV